MTPELNKIYCGEALKVLKQWPDGFADLIITSPPYYGLRKYGDYKEQIGLEKTFDEYLKKILEITVELKRVLKKSGQFWLNMGDCYGGTRWGNSPGTGAWNNRHFNEASIVHPKEDFGGSKCLMMMPERIALKMIDEQGWILRNKIKWAKQVLDFKEKKTKGSVMPSSVEDRFNESGEELYFFVKNKKYYSDLDAVRLPNQVLGVTDFRASGLVRSAELYPNSKYAKAKNQGKIDGRVSTHIKASDEEIKRYKENYIDDDKGARRGTGDYPDSKYQQCQYNPQYKYNDKKGENITHGKSKIANEIGLSSFEYSALFPNPLGKNLPTIWLIQSEPHNFQKEYDVDIDHFAIFPQALVEIPIKFGCPPGGLVFDPFMGSGTTAVVARKLGRKYLGIELSSDYIKIAEARLRQELLL